MKTFLAFLLLGSILFATPARATASSPQSPSGPALPAAPAGHIGEEKFFSAAYLFMAHPGRIMNVSLTYFRQASGLISSAIESLLRFFNRACGSIFNKAVCWSISPVNPQPYLMRSPPLSHYPPAKQSAGSSGP